MINGILATIKNRFQLSNRNGECVGDNNEKHQVGKEGVDTFVIFQFGKDCC